MSIPIGPYLAIATTAEAPADLYGPSGEQVSFNATLAGGEIGATWEIWPHRVESTLRMVALASLATDRRAEPDDELAPGDEDRRGWWCDAFNDRPIGSRLWLLEHRSVNDEAARLAKDYAEEALAWMVEEGLCSEVVVEAWRPANTRGRIAMTVDVITRTGGQRLFDTEDLWEALRA